MGNARAIFDSGAMHENGNGLPASDKEAAKRYREQDYTAAYPVILSYAEAGNEWAAHYIGLMYFNGYGVEQDEKESIKWFRYGAEYGVANSQWFLSYFYRNGRGGIESSPVEAYIWLKLAIPTLQQGEHRDRAEVELDSLVNTLTADQIGQADAYLGNIVPGIDESMMMGG